MSGTLFNGVKSSFDLNRGRSSIVNYLWLRKNKFDPDVGDKKSVLCGVPLENVDKAIENALRYPNAKFNLWVDFDELDDLSIYMMDHLIYASGIKNMQLKNLRDIPDYKDSLIFDPRKGIEVYPRADLARLLCIRYSVSQFKGVNVFYSDFDVDDIFIEHEDVLSTLKREQVVFAHTQEDPIENGYIGICGEAGQQFLDEVIFQTARESINGYLGYAPLLEVVENTYGSTGCVVVDLPILKERGYKIPKSKIYSDLRIC